MATNDNGGRVPVEIRKYPNRRYYDTTRSSYVTLQEIHDLICTGVDIRVVDSKTEEDLTLRVLTQIILDHDPEKLQIFPFDLLHALIRANDTLVRGLSESFFDHALFMFIESQRLFGRYARLYGAMVPVGLSRNHGNSTSPDHHRAESPAGATEVADQGEQAVRSSESPHSDGPAGESESQTESPAIA